jgi:elongation factor G
MGEVHDGAAHMDYLAEEQRHGITITAAVTKAPWRDHLIQLVDTPGHVDFTIEVERAMRVQDGCVLVLDGVRGVEPQTETVWRQRSRFGLPALLFVNKMDRPGADFRRSMDAVRQRLGGEPAPVTAPLPDGTGIVHLIDQTLIRFTGDQGEHIETAPCPEPLWADQEDLRETLHLAAADHDESLAEVVLSGGEPNPEALRAALRAGTLAGAIFPCYGGSALRNLGVQPLLDGIIDFLPAPLDRPPAQALRPDGERELIALGDDGPLVALAFKVQLWDGRRHVFARIYRGELKPGDAVEFIGITGEPRRETAARVFDVDAGKRAKLERAEAGQIVLIAGLRHATTGDTLCAPGHLLALERIEARAPVLGLAIEPAAGTEVDRLIEVLDKVTQEDPTLKVEEDPETGQRLLKGMGELHLQMVIERLEREFAVGVRSGRPAVAVRETIRRRASADALFAPPPLPDGKHPDLMARVALTVQPLERGAGVAVEVAPRVLPEGAMLGDEQRSAIELGVRSGLESGPLQGAALLDLSVRVQEAELFGPGSTPEALAAAAGKALRKAIGDADPALMKPVMALEVVVPEVNLGAVLGDLQSRAALILDTRMGEGTGSSDQAEVRAEGPLAGLLGYTTTLRSLTQGRGQFSMEFLRFDLA